MTEAEAKTKWCPYANVYVQYQHTGAAGNRGLSDSKDSQGNKSQVLCIGSACMAWREKTCSNDSGYCGLAGQP